MPEAEACYRQALVVKPAYPEACYNLGNVLRALGRLAEAEAAYRRAAELRPSDFDARNNLGTTLRDLGRLAEAEACHRQALCAATGQSRGPQ